MKKITVTFLLTLLFLGCLSVMNNAREVTDMTDKFIRIHIVANSDSDHDQELKLKVRDGVLSRAAEILSGGEDKSEAMAKIGAGMDEIKAAAEQVLRDNGCSDGVICSLGREDFGAREYDDFTLPAGEYDSLTVRIGEARGHNWWCICYPEICVGAAVKIEDAAALTDGELTIIKEPGKVRYKLWCYEIIMKIKHKLGI